MATASDKDVETVQLSFGRALFAGDVMGVFYEKFLASGQEISEKFTDTDLSKQKDLLKRGVNLAIMYAQGSVLGKSAMDRLSKSHSQAHLNVDPALYPKWKAAFIAAVGSLDKEFNAEVERAWDRVLQHAIDHIASGYATGERKSA